MKYTCYQIGERLCEKELGVIRMKENYHAFQKNCDEQDDLVCVTELIKNGDYETCRKLQHAVY